MAKKSWQQDVRESAHKIWLAGLGALATAEEEGSKLFTNLVKEGKRFESEGKVQWHEVRREVGEAATKAGKGARGALDRLEGTLDEQIARTLHRVGVPTRDEISTLARRVEELTHAVERLRGRQAAPGGAKTGAAKTGAAKGGTAKAGVPKAGASKAGAAKTASAKGDASRAAASGGAGKGSPLPRKITTPDDVTTTANVKTGPR